LDIRINKGDFSWNSTDDITLKDIDLTIIRGSLVLILGRVGSGKTTLLNSLLGELNKNNGTINIHRVLENGFAYVRLIKFKFSFIFIRLICFFYIVKNHGFNKCHFKIIFFSEKYITNNGIKKLSMLVHLIMILKYILTFPFLFKKVFFFRYRI